MANATVPARAGLRRRLPPVPAVERFNVNTALLGSALAVAAGAFIAARAPTELGRACGALLASTLVLNFVATAAHHWAPESALLRRLDHASIYFVIVGMAAPLCLLIVDGRAGRLTFLAIAALALAGAALKLAAPFLSPRANLWLYFPVPAPLVAAARELAQSATTLQLALLAGSLALFAGGAIVDAAERPAPRSIGAHGVFHLCVLAGSALSLAFAASAAGAL